MKIIIPSVDSIIRTNQFCSEMNGQKSVILDRGKLKVLCIQHSTLAQNHFKTVE